MVQFNSHSYSRTLLRYVRFMAWAVRPSVVCLTALRPTQRFELFGNIFASTNILGTRTVCVKILEKNSRVSGWHYKISGRGMKNWRFSTNILLYFENSTRYGRGYNGRRIGTRMRSID